MVSLLSIMTPRSRTLSNGVMTWFLSVCSVDGVRNDFQNYRFRAVALTICCLYRRHQIIICQMSLNLVCDNPFNQTITFETNVSLEIHLPCKYRTPELFS